MAEKLDMVFHITNRVTGVHARSLQTRVRVCAFELVDRMCNHIRFFIPLYGHLGRQFVDILGGQLMVIV